MMSWIWRREDPGVTRKATPGRQPAIPKARPGEEDRRAISGVGRGTTPTTIRLLTPTPTHIGADSRRP